MCFFTWYIAATIACIICAIVTVRIPPISNIDDRFKDGSEKPYKNLNQSQKNIFRSGLEVALNTADQAPPIKTLVRLASKMSLEQLFAVLGPSLALGTMSTILAFHSPIGEMIGSPIAWILSFFSVENSKYIAPGFIFGFLDQFVPAVIAGNVANETMRFVLAGLSICQIIFMSETGVIILRSGLPVNLLQLFQLFVIRTLIIIPILLLFALMTF